MGMGALALSRSFLLLRATRHIGSSRDQLSMNVPAQQPTASPPSKAILHLCKREMLRPIRDQILRLSGYAVSSTCAAAEALTLFRASPFALVLIDVEGSTDMHEAERLCSEVKTSHHGQLVAFVCNWRVATLTDCPDEILRTEFDPAAFVAGVHKMLQ